MSGILFLEDDAVQMVIYKTIAKRHLQDFDLFFASTAVEAEKIINENSIELAIFDIMMPDQNGADLIVKIKNDHNKRDIRILVVTAADRKSLLFDSLKPLVDEFITKPIDPTKFISLIKTLETPS